MRACVIVSDLTSEGMLAALLLALCHQDCPFEYEILVPDFDGFPPAELSILSSLTAQYPRLRVVKAVSRNRAAVLNRIVAGSGAEMLVFVESHCLVPASLLSRCAAVLEEGVACAVVSRRVDLPSPEPVRHYETRLANEVMGGMDAGYYFDFHGSAVTRACFDRLGGLDERVPYFAEFEFGARLHCGGRIIARLDDLPVLHQNSLALSTYCRIVYLQAFDRSVIFLTHAPEFNRRYFVAGGFVRFLPWLRGFRRPLLVLLKSLNLLAALGFWLAARWTPNGFAYACFRVAARSSAVMGRIAGLGFRGR